MRTLVVARPLQAENPRRHGPPANAPTRPHLGDLRRESKDHLPGPQQNEFGLEPKDSGKQCLLIVRESTLHLTLGSEILLKRSDTVNEIALPKSLEWIV